MSVGLPICPVFPSFIHFFSFVFGVNNNPLGLLPPVPHYITHVPLLEFDQMTQSNLGSCSCSANPSNFLVCLLSTPPQLHCGPSSSPLRPFLLFSRVQPLNSALFYSGTQGTLLLNVPLCLSWLHFKVYNGGRSSVD